MILNDLVGKLFPSTRVKPSDFRRGKQPVRILGYSPDHNSKHIGTFKGGIVPMKRRFKGVSRKGKQ